MGCFTHCFRQGRVRMDVVRHLPWRGLQELPKRRLGDELRDRRTDHVNAKYVAGLLVSDQLHEAGGVVYDLRPGVRRKRKSPDLQLDATLSRLLLRHTDRSDLREAKNGLRDPVGLDRLELILAD